jgi:hypothetical protein
MIISTFYYDGDGQQKLLSGFVYKPVAAFFFGRELNTYATWRTKDMPYNACFRLCKEPDSEIINDAIIEFQENGILIGTHDYVNKAGNHYHGIAFGDDGEDDIHVGTYLGIGNYQDIIKPDMGFTPDFAISQGDNNYSAIIRTKACSGVWSMELNDADTEFGICSFLENGFNAGFKSNTLDVLFYFLCLKEVIPYTKFSSYLGTGNDNEKITEGYKSYELWIKRASTSGTYPMLGKNLVIGDDDLTCYFREEAAIANAIQKLLDDGFELGTNYLANDLDKTYRYMEFRSGRTSPEPAEAVNEFNFQRNTGSKIRLTKTRIIAPSYYRTKLRNSLPGFIE